MRLLREGRSVRCLVLSREEFTWNGERCFGGKVHWYISAGGGIRTCDVDNCRFGLEHVIPRLEGKLHFCSSLPITTAMATTYFNAPAYRYRHIARIACISVAAPRVEILSAPQVNCAPVQPLATLTLTPTSTTPARPLLDQVRLFLGDIDAAFSPGLLSSGSEVCPLSVPLEIVLHDVPPDQYGAIRSLVDTGLPGSSAAKMSKLDYYADGRLIITFPTQVHEVLTGIIEYMRDQMWEQDFYWKSWSDKKDRIILSKSMSMLYPRPIHVL